MHKNSFHNCSLTIFNYLKIVRDLKQKSMNSRLLFCTRLFLLIFGSYPCYWTVVGWGKNNTNMFTVLALRVQKLCSALGQLRAVGEQKPGVRDALPANHRAYSRGPSTDVAPKRRTVTISFEYHGVKYHLFAAFRIL